AQPAPPSHSGPPAHAAPTSPPAPTALTPPSSDLAELREALVRFREDRRWGVYHNPKDLAVALSVEAGELLEVFLWKSGEEADMERVKEELADVMAYALLLAERCNLDVRQIILDKIAQNALKYPVDKAAGNARKYTDL
ncbi:MAG: nucleotide pyrophosphohydrolase, partial [Bacteroidota bacterium]